MGKLRILGLCLFLLGAVGALAAQQQQQSQREVSRIFFTTVKPGMELQFEKAVKAHADWHRQQKDDWAWVVRYTETGPRSDEYIFISGNHQWTDFDNRKVTAQADGEHFVSTVSQFVESARSIILQSRPDMSRGKAETGSSPLAMVTYFHVKYGQQAKFEDAIRQINQALDQTDAPRLASWLQAIGSGRNSIYVLSSPRENWAAFDMQGPSVRERVEKAFGKAKSDAIFQSMVESVDFTDAKITSARPDLSYVP